MIPPRHHSRFQRRALGLLALLTGLLALPGCGGEKVVKLDDYLEELEFDTPLEAVKEIKIGNFRLPSAAHQHDATGRGTAPMWVQLKFHLYAIVAEEDEIAVLAALERHRGMVNDAVITVCRRASIDELQDNRWATIKSNLLDTVRPLLGENRIRRITLNGVLWEPI